MNDDESWSDLDQSQFVFETLAKDHPSRVVTAFHDFCQLDPPPVEMLEQFVTPERRSDWGDFGASVTFFLDQDVAISTRALRHKGALDVAYIKLVPDDGVYYSDTPRQDVLAIVTLVWRPELGGWRIHSIGDPQPPHLLPRSDVARTAPRYDADAEIEVIRDI